MKTELFKYNFNHGTVDGHKYGSNSNDNKKVALIVNGLNGFSTYGMFPQLQKKLAENSISSYALNFSHGGIRGDNDYFTELSLYEKNCMRLEIADIFTTIEKIFNEKDSYKELFLISHSLGSIPVSFAAEQILKNNYPLKGIIFLSPSMNLDFWGSDNMLEWEKNKRLKYYNKRTEQTLFLGEEFLNETKESDTTWNLEVQLNKVKVKYLILHGEKDESIPIEEASVINAWNKKWGNQSELIIIKNANHNFNIKHPFVQESVEFSEMINEVIKWINKI